MASSEWPPVEGLSTPTVSRKDAVFQTSGSTRIAAPASAVFDKLLEVSEYGKWNSFVPRVDILSQPEGASDATRLTTGTIMYFQVVMNSAKPTSFTQTELQVSDISTPDKPSDYISAETLASDPSFTSDLSKVYRISWLQHGGFATRGLATERFNEIIVIGDNECELRTWEVYGGLLAHTVKWLYRKTLLEKFQMWSDDLKKYVESSAAVEGVA